MRDANKSKVAAAKGLVVGSFTVTLKDSLVLNCDAGAKVHTFIDCAKTVA